MHLESFVETVCHFAHQELDSEEAQLLVQALPEMDRSIIAWRFGLEGKPKSVKEVAMLYQLSEGRIRQIEARAIKRLCSTLKIKRESTEQDPLDWSIEALNLPMRTLTCLKRERITKIRELIGFSEYDLLHLRNFGKRCLAEVREKLALIGLKLKRD